MAKSKEQKIIKDNSGQEAIMLRVDRTLKEMMEEQPSGRFDADYWHPKYEQDFSAGDSFEIKNLEGILNTPIIAPDHVRASKEEATGSQFDCEYRTLKDLLFTGLNYAEINYCSENACQRLKRTKMEVEDILFAGSGVGAIGRVGIVEKVADSSCVGDLFIIRNPKVDPYYLYVYLLTEAGQKQIERIFHGVQSAKINREEIGLIKAPIIPSMIQQNTREEYKKMSRYHMKAMDAKKDGKDKDYKKNIETAEEMLKDLIGRTEAVIRGETKDVI